MSRWTRRPRPLWKNSQQTPDRVTAGANSTGRAQGAPREAPTQSDGAGTCDSPAWPGAEAGVRVRDRLRA